MTVHENITELIGHTPLVELTNYERAHELPATLIGKVESFNPTGSVKDRAAQSMIDAAVEAGVLDDETVIIEPTSGNTGIGLSAIAAVRGNRIIIVMPETMSVERRNLMRAFGAELVLTEGAKGMKGAIEEAERLAAEIPNSFIPSQFSNPANPAVHERTTGPEIWEDTDGAVDILVAGVGTGGTLSGTGAYLKAQNPAIQVVAVEPAGSPVLSEGRAGAHKIQCPRRWTPLSTTRSSPSKTRRPSRPGASWLPMTDCSWASPRARPWRRRRSWRADPKTWARTSSSSCPTRASATFPPPCSISRKPSTFLFRYKFVGSSTASGALGNGRGSIRKAPFRPTEESSTWQPRRPPYFPL